MCLHNHSHAQKMRHLGENRCNQSQIHDYFDPALWKVIPLTYGRCHPSEGPVTGGLVLIEPSWKYYQAPGGGEVVLKEIADELAMDVNLLVKLESLQDRIRTGQALPRDVTALGDGLYEARLSVRRNEWRLFYARRNEGLVFLALHFVQKKRRSVPRAIKKARDRLKDWDGQG
jgi:phage-related protein